MDLEEAKGYVKEAKAAGAEIVCITGGEPMLCFDLVKEVVSECLRLSIPDVWLFTNGFWADKSSEAFTIVKNLKELGLTKVFLSVDVFHQGYVPIEFVKKAIRASLRADLEVSVDSRFIGQPDGKNQYDSTTRQLLECLGSLLSEIEIVRAQPLLVGRAAEFLAQQIEKQPFKKILGMECPGAWPGGTLKSPSGVDVDELGFVTICPGLSIGNTCAKSLGSMLRKYDYRNHAVVAALHDNGMRGLMDLASRRGFVPQEAYVNGCHFCYEARKFLRAFIPDALRLRSHTS